ncbi:MAG: DUF4855 domain-containing protein, partial [Deltaproteobacteria bacterium]|nr:DUF4855 domain-containing protein [Deltaproteobacteria bacterium]
QVVAGSKATPYGAWVKAGGASLVKNGDFSASTSWTGLVAAPGFEHAIRPGASYLTVVQGPVAVQGGGTYTLGAKLRAETDIAGHEGILGVRVFDSAGKEIVKGMSGMAYSTATIPPMYYAYADTSTTWTDWKVTFTVPSQAATIKVYLVAWDKNAGVAFDAIQLNAGSAVLSEASLAQRGYGTLIGDGNAEEESGASPWRVVPRYPLPSDQGIVPSLAWAASTLGDRRRRNVILGIPVGVGFTTQTEFGIVKGRHLDLTRSADRLEAVTWFIDTALA